MGRIIILVSFLIYLIFFNRANAQVSSDIKTLQAVAEASAAQYSIESLHNAELAQMYKKKREIRDFNGKIVAIKEAYKIAMQNTEGFGEESQIYTSIVKTAVEIMHNIPIAIKELKKRPYAMAGCYKDMSELSLATTSAINTFVNIVNNGKVSIKIKDLPVEGTNDGYNFINRMDRYILANSILTELREIKYKLDGIIYLTRFCNGISDIIYGLDIDTWVSYMSGKSIVKGIIEDYRILLKS